MQQKPEVERQDEIQEVGFIRHILDNSPP